jgi:hypothetical protein
MDAPQTTATPAKTDAACFACYEGVVYLGYLAEDEDGATAEVFEPVPCRRCSGR